MDLKVKKLSLSQYGFVSVLLSIVVLIGCAFEFAANTHTESNEITVITNIASVYSFVSQVQCGRTINVDFSRQLEPDSENVFEKSDGDFVWEAWQAEKSDGGLVVYVYDYDSDGARWYLWNVFYAYGGDVHLPETRYDLRLLFAKGSDMGMPDDIGSLDLSEYGKDYIYYFDITGIWENRRTDLTETFNPEQYDSVFVEDGKVCGESTQIENLLIVEQRGYIIIYASVGIVLTETAVLVLLAIKKRRC